MSETSVVITGLDVAIRKAGDFSDTVKDIADDVMGVVASAMDVEALRIVTVKTGNLKRSIKKTHPAKCEYIVGASALYAGAVEFGTSKQRAKPYMRPALETSIPKGQNMLPAIIAQRLR